eukprot:GSChrysophyteH2.ASY1.ANO1.1152.1 assembled CDS
MSFIRAVAVSYEGSLFGWDVNAREDGEDEGLVSDLVFGFHAAQGSLKALSVSESGKYMVCGGMDEHIRIFNVAENRCLGELNGHTGAITCLEFVGDKFIVSGSDDMNLCIWRVQDWECVHILGGHKASVNDLSIHPSGKMALSVSKDNTLKLWNLVQGRCAFTRRLQGPADKVEWNSDGNFYLLVVGAVLHVYDAADNKRLSATKFPARVNQARFTNVGDAANASSGPCGYIAVLLDNKTIQIMDTSSTDRLPQSFSLSNLLDNGRPRDLYSCKPCLNHGSATLQEALQGEGHSLTIASSLGGIVVLSARALYEGVLADSEKVCAKDKSSVCDRELVDASFAALVVTSVQAQPRLTAVVAWNPAHRSAPKPKAVPQQQRRQQNKKRKYTGSESDDTSVVVKSVRFS